MNKKLGIVCGLAVLSGCSYLNQKPDTTTAATQRHSPSLNEGGAGAAPSMATGAMPAFAPGASPFASPTASGMSPMPGADSAFPSAGRQPEMTAAMPAAPLPSNRRMPEFNRAALAGGQNSPVQPVIISGQASGDLLGAVPAAPVAPTQLGNVLSAPVMPEALPVPPAPPAAMAAAPAPALIPMARAEAKARKEEFPRLADVPPAPALPKPASLDPRVQEMKKELEDMQGSKNAISTASTKNFEIDAPAPAPTAIKPKISVQSPDKLAALPEFSEPAHEPLRVPSTFHSGTAMSADAPAPSYPEAAGGMTKLSDLHPIEDAPVHVAASDAPAPATPYAVASDNGAADTGVTPASGLVPLQSHSQDLPDSRYAQRRMALSGGLRRQGNY